MVTLADRSTELNPDFLSEVVLYALSAADLTMLVALAFVLARNIVKLVVERRRGLPFSRFRAKLVLALLGLTIVPSVLVLIVGGELIRSSTETLVQPADRRRAAARRRRSPATTTASAKRVVEASAARIAAALPAPAMCRRATPRRVRRAIAPGGTDGRVALVEVYRARAERRRPAASRPIVDGGVAGAAARALARRGRHAGGARAGRRRRSADVRAARRRQRAGARRRGRPRPRRRGRSASWSPAITCPGSSRRTPGASPRPTRNTTQLRGA